MTTLAGMVPELFGLPAATVELIGSVMAMSIHAVVIGVVLLARGRDPTATLAWILLVVLAPGVGVLLYFALGRSRMRRAIERSASSEARLYEVLSRYEVSRKLAGTPASFLSDRTRAQLGLGNALASTPASHANAARILTNAAATYREMIVAIESAEHHIHVEFYIIQPDQVGRALRDRLAKRAAEGVEVRVLVDSVGSMALPRDFWKPLESAGGRAAAFAPVYKMVARFRRRDRIDYRNHRKIVVVDGCVGFTGGINVGREYLGLDPDIGQWRDTHVRIDGPAVLSLQHTFARDWLRSTNELLDDARYFPDGGSGRGDCIVQVVDSGPDQTWASMALIHAQAMSVARERVWITNPYFIPSPTIESSLIVAALRGVDVRLLLPAKSDSLLVRLASRSYYEELLHAGVRIFEYERGFVHAKTMVVDRWLGTVGSANMDMRSFNLNYELNAFVFDERFSDDLVAQFALDLEQASEVTLESESRAGVPRRLARSAARLLSPLL